MKMPRILITGLFLLFLSTTSFAQTREPVDNPCSEDEVLHNNFQCSPSCTVNSDCNESIGEYCVNGRMCERDCEATTIIGPCGTPMDIAAMPTHQSRDTFLNGTTSSIACENGQITVQIVSYEGGQTCSPFCGDGQCLGAQEDCSTCAADCGACSVIEPSNIVEPNPFTEELTGPRNNVRAIVPTTLRSDEVDFRWSTGKGLGSAYYMQVGTCDDDPTCIADIFTGANPSYLFTYPTPINVFPNLGPFGHKVVGIPQDGEPIFVRLMQFDNTNNERHIQAFKYNTFNITPHISNPEPGSILIEHKPLFSCEGENIENCFFMVGSRPGMWDYGYQFGNYVQRPVDTYEPYYLSGTNTNPNTVVTGVTPITSTVHLPLEGEKVFVTFYHWGQGVPFTMEKAHYKTINCGNGVVDECEFCDDGNTIDNDGCSETCQHTFIICERGDLDCFNQGGDTFIGGVTRSQLIEGTGTTDGQQEFWGN